MIRCCLIMLLTFSNFAQAAEKFIIPPKHIVAIAKSLAYKDFPKTLDILAICRVESAYKINAVNPETGSVGPSRGVMQVQNGDMELYRNMHQGVGLLREYYVRLGSKQAAVSAYNIGIGSYRRGKAKISAKIYYSKFVKRRRELVRYYGNNL